MKNVKFRYESASARLQYVEKDVVVLNNLWAEERGHGHASELLKQITEYADARNLTVLAVAQRYGNANRSALNNRQLEEFYEKFGFELDGTRRRPALLKRVPSRELHAS